MWILRGNVLIRVMLWMHIRYYQEISCDNWTCWQVRTWAGCLFDTWNYRTTRIFSWTHRIPTLDWYNSANSLQGARAWRQPWFPETDQIMICGILGLDLGRKPQLPGCWQYVDDLPPYGSYFQAQNARWSFLLDQTTAAQGSMPWPWKDQPWYVWCLILIQWGGGVGGHFRGSSNLNKSVVKLWSITSEIRCNQMNAEEKKKMKRIWENNHQ